MNCECRECKRRTSPALDDVSRDEDVDPGEEGGEGALPPQLHFHVEQEVTWMRELALQVDGAGVRVQLPGAEVAVLVAAADADDDVVAGVGGRRTHAEDERRDDDVDLEAELVVGDSHRRVLARHEVRAADSLTPCVRSSAVVGWTAEGQTAKSAVNVVACFLCCTVMSSDCTLVYVVTGASVRSHAVSMFRTGTVVTSWDVHTLVGTEMTDALRTFISIFTGVCVLTQVVALSAVTLVRAIDVHTLVTTRTAQTLIHIFTALAIAG